MLSSNRYDARSVINDIIITHDVFQRALDRMESLWRDAESQIPFVSLFVGETGTGKSTIIRTFAMRHPQKRTPEGLIVPVLCINTPSKPTPRGLAERILHSLGDPRPTAGSASSKLDRIVKNLVAAQVRAMVLDDLQHFVDKRQQIAIFDASDYLKELIISSGIGLFCFGLPESELVIESNEQLMTRSKAPFKLQRFDWTNKLSQNQFVAVLKGFQEEIKGFEFPDLTSPEMALRMYLATGGLIRYVAKVLSKALGNAIDTGTHTIRSEDLSNAWSEEVVGSNTEYEDPFSANFSLTDLPNKVAHAKKIGQRALRPTLKRQRKPGSVLVDVGL